MHSAANAFSLLSIGPSRPRPIASIVLSCKTYMLLLYQSSELDPALSRWFHLAIPVPLHPKRTGRRYIAMTALKEWFVNLLSIDAGI